MHGEQVNWCFGLGSYLASQVSAWSNEFALLEVFFLLLLVYRAFLLIGVRGGGLGRVDLELYLESVSRFRARIVVFVVPLHPQHLLILWVRWIVSVLANSELVASIEQQAPTLLNRSVPPIQVVHAHLPQILVVVVEDVRIGL